MTRWLTLGSMIAIGGVASGCGESCQSTCVHVYDASECGIVKSGLTADRVIRDCISECNVALSTPGALGDYNPTQYAVGNENIALETDQQAAAWIDCVWAVAPDNGPQPSCDDLNPGMGGICAPI